MQGKMKENEENRSLNDKKAYEDQFTAFCWFNFRLSDFNFLILLHTWRNLGACLEHSSIHLDLEK